MNRMVSEDTESVEIVKDSMYIPALTTKDPISAGEYIDLLTLQESLYAILPDFSI